MKVQGFIIVCSDWNRTAEDLQNMLLLNCSEQVAVKTQSKFHKLLPQYLHFIELITNTKDQCQTDKRHNFINEMVTNGCFTTSRTM